MSLQNYLLTNCPGGNHYFSNYPERNHLFEKFYRKHQVKGFGEGDVYKSERIHDGLGKIYLEKYTKVNNTRN